MCLEKLQILKHDCGKHILLAWKPLLSTIKTTQHSASVNLEFLIFFVCSVCESIVLLPFMPPAPVQSKLINLSL